MRTLRRWRGKIVDWMRRGRREQELAAELEAHIELEAADHRRAGLSPEEARRRALIKLGGLESTREAMRDVWSLRGIDTIAQDVRYAVRSLRRAPVFTSAAVVSLALGLGAGVAIFSVADNLLIRPLPYPDAHQLVMLWETTREGAGSPRRGLGSISPGNYFDWQAQSTDIFDTLAGFREGQGRASVLVVGTRVEELRKQLVTANLLPMLGVQPVRGRLFTPEEDRPGVIGPLIVSYRVWQSWFGGDPEIAGRTVQLNGGPRTIVGVLPAGFFFRDREVDLWEPLGLNPSYDYRNREGRWMLCLGRLKPGVTIAQAQARMTAIAAQLEITQPKFNRDMTVGVESFRDWPLREVRWPLLILLGAVGLLLAVSCANVAGLLLARCDGRRRELAVRASLGAGRGRVVRLLLIESLVLGLVSAAVALVLARGIVAALIALAPKALLAGTGAQIGIDWRIVMFGLGVSFITSMLFGLAPALTATGHQLANPMREDTRTTTGGRGGVRAWLVTAEIAVTVVLLVGAVLFFRTLTGIQALNPGLDPSNVLAVRVTLPFATYKEVPRRTQFYARAIADIEQLPGVRAVSAIGDVPFTGGSPASYVNFEGQPSLTTFNDFSRIVVMRSVMPGYFRTMRIPLRSGREFAAEDNAPTAPMRFVVSEAFVRKFIDEGREALGTRLQALMNPVNPFGEIIGVVGDVREATLDKPPVPTLYYVYDKWAFPYMNLVIRADGDPLALADPIRRIVTRLDPAQPIANVTVLEDAIADTVARQRFSAALLSAFSLLSLLLACVGIYGVLAYSVSQRTREIGVRMALGARPGRILRLIVHTGARMILIGLAVGLAGALAVSRLIESLLFGVGPRDLTTFIVVALILAAVALIAATLPAIRAARLDPTRALRAD